MAITWEVPHIWEQTPLTNPVTEEALVYTTRVRLPWSSEGYPVPAAIEVRVHRLFQQHGWYLTVVWGQELPIADHLLVCSEIYRAQLEALAIVAVQFSHAIGLPQALGEFVEAVGLYG